MKKEYSQQDVERILKSDAQIPESVDLRIQETYRELGLIKNTGRQSTRRRIVHRKKRKVWAAVAAAAVLTAGLGVTVFAVSQLMNADLKETEDGLIYEISVAPETKEAHDIKVTPTYVPEGYVYHEEGAYASKWHNDTTDGGMTIIKYNAADLYKMSKTQEEVLHAMFDKDSFVKTTDVNEMKTDVFSTESIYTDEDSVTQNVFLFNEEYGYAVHVYLEGAGLAEDEALKVAEGLDIEVLDTTVAYASDQEIENLKKEIEAANGESNVNSYFYEIGDEITPPSENGLDDVLPVTHKVTDIQILDSLPLDQYPKEYYIDDYDTVVAPLLNEDGTLKDHERYPLKNGTVVEDEIESTSTKFLVATTEITNTGDTAQEIYIAPDLMLLTDNGSGYLTEYSYWPASEAYLEFVSDHRIPEYQTVQMFTENQKKHVHFAEIGAGETITCTFAWALDEDCIDDAYLGFYNVAADAPKSLVKVAE